MKYAHMYISHTICIFCVCTICIRVLALNMSNATKNNSEKTRERERLRRNPSQTSMQKNNRCIVQYGSPKDKHTKRLWLSTDGVEVVCLLT